MGFQDRRYKPLTHPSGPVGIRAFFIVPRLSIPGFDGAASDPDPKQVPWAAEPQPEKESKWP
jgi:hypothetical protein